MQNQLDPHIVNLAKSIRQVESGGNFQSQGKSGEYGAYQFTEPTWNAQASKFGVNVPLKQATPEQQNEVAYKQLSEWKQLHPDWNIGNYASAWNAGEGKPNAYLENHKGVNSYGVSYDTPTYAKNVATAYQQIKAQSGQQNSQTQPSSVVPNQSNAGIDTPLQAAGKTASNFIPSAINFGKGILNSINPINTIKNLAKIPGEAMGLASDEGSIGSKIGNIAQGAYEATVPQAGRSLLAGDLKGTQNAIVNDPVGQIAPFLLAAEGGTKAIDNATAGSRGAADMVKSVATGRPLESTPGYAGNALDTAISKTAGMVTKPVSTLVGGAENIVGGAAKSAASHVLSLEPDTMESILKSPEAFSKIAQDQASRGGLANEFGNAVDNLQNTLDETGSGYDPIRKSESSVAVPEDFIKSTLDKYGLKLEDGQVIADSNSITRNPGDIRAVQNFVDNWDNKQNLTPNEYLNMRKDIAGIAKFGKEIGTNVDAQKIGTDLYSEANRTIRPQIQGLKELDEQYSPIKQQFEQIKKDFLKKSVDGGYEFKDNAVNKIANAAGVGKDALLSRMEEISPGITKKIQILKAVEDIQKAYGNKVGAYGKAIVEGGAIATGNIPLAVITAILTNPKFAVPLLRGLGYTAAKVAPIVATMKMIAGDINSFKVPGTQGVQSDNANTENNPITKNVKSPFVSTPTQKEKTK